jgi:hypothetical protein
MAVLPKKKKYINHGTANGKKKWVIEKMQRAPRNYSPCVSSCIECKNVFVEGCLYEGVNWQK